MRNLTITRQKTSVGCLAKMKVYVADSNYGDINIGGVQCRFIGTLKNGETASFPIDNEATRVYVIAGKSSRNTCNDFYEIPAGEEDVNLEGRNRYDPVVGNSFMFDNNYSVAAMENRRKNKKRAWVWLGVAIVVGFAIGIISAFIPSEEYFYVDEMNIMLTDDFWVVEAEGYNACFLSDDVTVFVLKESLKGTEYANYTVYDYGNLLIEVNEINSSVVTEENGVVHFDYTYNVVEENTVYYYFTSVYKSNDAYWMIQFAVEKEDFVEYKDDILSWAASVTFDE